MEVIEKQLKEFEQIDGLLEKKEIFSSERLFKCILGLNKTESKILGYMLKNKDVRTSEIADVLHMDRSSIQRAVQVLSELKLIDRKSMSMKDYTATKELKDVKKQGYLYVYNAPVLLIRNSFYKPCLYHSVHKACCRTRSHRKRLGGFRHHAALFPHQKRKYYHLGDGDVLF